MLRASLVAGALYDLFFGAFMLLAPEVPARWFDLPLPPLPEGRFYLWLLAILLAMLAALYLAAARDPRRYSAILAVAIAGRIAGGAALFVAYRSTGLAGLLPLAAGDLTFGVVHALAWGPLRS